MTMLRDAVAVQVKNITGMISASNPLDTSSPQYKLVKFDPSDSQPTYIGLNLVMTAVDDDTTWEIYKFDYSGVNATRIRRATGSWTNRASLFS